MNVSIVLKLLDGVTGPLRRVAQEVANAGKAMEGAKSKADAAFKSSAAIKHSADAMNAFGAKARAAIVDVVQTFEPFDEAMTRVKALTGASGEEFASLTAQARALGASGRFSAVDVATGMEQLRGSGYGVSEIMASLHALANDAVVGNTTLEASIGSTTGMLDAFALGHDKLAMAIDVSTTAASAAGTSVGAMREALGIAGVAAAQAGISFARTAALAGLLAQRHIEGAKAGATLDTALKLLKDPPDDAVKFFRNMGVALTETVGGVKRMRDPLTVLIELQRSMGKHGVTATDQLKNMKELFGGAAPEIQAMLEAAQAGGLDDMNKAIKASTGQVAKLAGEMKNNGAESTRNLGAAYEELKTTFGEALKPVTEPFKNGMDEALRGLTDFIKDNPAFAQSLAVVAVAVAAAATALGGLLGAVSAIVATKGLLILASGMWGIAAPVLAAVAPFVAIAAAIGAVTLAIVQLVKAWDTLDIGEAFSGMKDAFGDGSFWKTMTINPFSGLGGDAKGALGDAAAALGPNLPSQQAGASAAPPEATVRVVIDSEGRPTVKSQKASGIALETDAGFMMGGT